MTKHDNQLDIMTERQGEIFVLFVSVPFICLYVCVGGNFSEISSYDGAGRYGT